MAAEAMFACNRCFKRYPWSELSKSKQLCRPCKALVIELATQKARPGKENNESSTTQANLDKPRKADPPSQSNPDWVAAQTKNDPKTEDKSAGHAASANAFSAKPDSRTELVVQQLIQQVHQAQSSKAFSSSQSSSRNDHHGRDQNKSDTYGKTEVNRNRNSSENIPQKRGHEREGSGREHKKSRFDQVKSSSSGTNLNSSKGSESDAKGNDSSDSDMEWLTKQLEKQDNKVKAETNKWGQPNKMSYAEYKNSKEYIPFDPKKSKSSGYLKAYTGRRYTKQHVSQPKFALDACDARATSQNVGRQGTEQRGSSSAPNLSSLGGGGGGEDSIIVLTQLNETVKKLQKDVDLKSQTLTEKQQKVRDLEMEHFRKEKELIDKSQKSEEANRAKIDVLLAKNTEIQTKIDALKKEKKEEEKERKKKKRHHKSRDSSPSISQLDGPSDQAPSMKECLSKLRTFIPSADSPSNLHTVLVDGSTTVILS